MGVLRRIHHQVCDIPPQGVLKRRRKSLWHKGLRAAALIDVTPYGVTTYNYLEIFSRFRLHNPISMI